MGLEAGKKQRRAFRSEWLLRGDWCCPLFEEDALHQECFLMGRHMQEGKGEMARVGGKQALAEARVMQIAGLELKRMNFSSYYTTVQCCITHSLTLSARP